MLSLKTSFKLLGLIFSIGILNVSSYTPDEYQNLIMSISNIAEYRNDFENNVQKLLKQEPNYFDYTPFDKENYTFDCNTKDFVSPVIPTSVHKLRPGDVKIVAALGLSLFCKYIQDKKIQNVKLFKAIL